MVVRGSSWLYPPPKVQPNFYVTNRILKLRVIDGKSTEVMAISRRDAVKDFKRWRASRQRAL